MLPRKKLLSHVLTDEYFDVFPECVGSVAGTGAGTGGSHRSGQP